MGALRSLNRFLQGRFVTVGKRSDALSHSPKPAPLAARDRREIDVGMEMRPVEIDASVVVARAAWQVRSIPREETTGHVASIFHWNGGRYARDVAIAALALQLIVR